MIDKWFIHASLGPGIESNELVEDEMTQEQADEYAYYSSIELYQSYEGLHGIMTEDECESENSDYNEEVENTIDYRAEPYNPEKHDGLL